MCVKFRKQLGQLGRGSASKDSYPTGHIHRWPGECRGSLAQQKRKKGRRSGVPFIIKDDPTEVGVVDTSNTSLVWLMLEQYVHYVAT